MSRATVRDCSLLNVLVVVNLRWELFLEHPPTNCSVGACAQNVPGLKSLFGTSDLCF